MCGASRSCVFRAQLRLRTFSYIQIQQLVDRKEIQMSDLGDLIDDMWDSADPDASSSSGCLVKIIGGIIFFAILGIMIYFMK